MFDDVLGVIVSDDGIGFDINDSNHRLTKGIGLESLRGRVNKLNGEFMVDSSKGKGTTVIIEIPI